MVFGWGKKKKEEEYEEYAETIRPKTQSITLNEIPKILEDIVTLRKKTLATEIRSHRNQIDPQREVLLKIANELHEDDLNPDELDPHLQIMVNRGKKEVISSIKKEFANPFPEINSPNDVMRFKKISSAGINKVGDMLGKHSKVIHILARKYAKKLKQDLENLKADLDEVDELIANFSITENSIKQIQKLLSSRENTLQKISKQNTRINELKASSNEHEERAVQLENTIEEIKNSTDYNSYIEIQSRLSDCESEEKQIRHDINDEFTKISRPLGKFVHISAHDKELKDLTAKLANSPFDVLNTENIPGIKSVLDSIIIGINTGSVSVKDVSKSKQSVEEIKDSLQSLINTKETFESKKYELTQKLENINLQLLQNAENDLKNEERNLSDVSSKIKSLEEDTLELTNSLPQLLHQIETNLKDVSSTSYTISTDN
tara:strand:- start:1069 stop:2367 length:1299 start_codon:yes stop_codon:yes gene_type:complete